MKFKRYDKTFIQAHRGASGYHIDNTMEAFKKAIEFKVDSIELDIRKTLDNKIIAVHDPLYKGKHINSWLYQDLLNETNKDGFYMPDLIEVLNECKGKILIDIELKETGYEMDVIKLVLSVLNINQFYIRSFHEKSLRVIKENYPDIYTILLVGTFKPKGGIFGRIPELFPKRKIKESKCDGISPNYQLLRFGFIKRMHKKNLAVYVWTVNDATLMNKLIKKKVDGIVTNYPDVLKKIIEN